MRHVIVLQPGQSRRIGLGFRAFSARVDNPGQHTVDLAPAGWQVQPGRVQVTQTFEHGTTQATMVSIPVAPGQPTEPAIVTFYDTPQPLDSGQLLPTPDQLPPAPLDLTATIVDSGVTLSWQPVTSTPPVLGYQVRLNFAEPPYTTSGNSLFIGTLANNQIYAATVNAVNAAGNGPSSGITLFAPIAAIPWQPIVDAAQVSHTHLAGTNPDSFPVGTNPVWVVGPGGDYTVVQGAGIYLPAGATPSFAIIDPQAAGDHTINYTFFANQVQPVYLWVIHDGVGQNWLAVVFGNVAGSPCLAVQSQIGGAASNIALLGTNYANDIWNVNINLRVVRNTLSIVMGAVNAAGTATLSASTGNNPLVFNNILNSYRDFGFQLFDNSGVPHQAIQSMAFTAP